jgi:DNA topoisomerase-6 subunit B
MFMAPKESDPKPKPAAAAASQPAAPAPKKGAAKEEAKSVEDIEKEFREYSVAEFFKKNRQMLGYTGKVRSLTTIVHEAVSNSLDACEDAKILPEIQVEVQELPNGHYKVAVEDNGTGVPKSKVGLAFGKLLAGTKFHQRAQKRGQQGIGISYAVLFSQLTTGKESHIKTSIGGGKVYECDISVDVQKNEPHIKNEKETAGKFQGTRFEGEFAEVTYNRSEYSVYEYLRRTALANPHAQLTLIEPTKEIVVFPRAAREIPKKPDNVLPHPLGIHTSDLIDMAKGSEARKISSFLTNDFARVSSDKAKELEELVAKDGKGDPVDFDRAPKTLTWPEAERIVHAIGQVKWISPETSALIPIGEKTIEKSLKALLQPEQLAVSSRRPRVFRGGIPFLVEAAIAYGGKAGAAKEGGVKGSELLRFANRVPLLFDAGTCATSEAVKTIDWGRYDLKPLEEKPVSIFINFVSVYVPYTGAGKLAISQEEEIVQEIRQALMECARDVSVYLHGLAKAEEQERRRTLFFRYIDEVARALETLTGKDRAVLMQKLQKMAKERTEIALRGEEEEVDKELEKLEKAEKQLEEEV